MKTENLDQLIPDAHRRMTGSFFTPPIFADKAHEYIARTFGDNWREEYVVWDPACGTGNLTRDYNFKELYLSTLEQHDVDIINKMSYNKGATVFQYDFLNDDLEELPKGLLQAMKDKRKIIVLTNPPYGRAGTLTENKTENAGVALTKVNKEMIVDKIGKSSAQLYAQFMYRLAKMQEQFNCEVNICTFAPPLFMSGGSFEGFREFFFERYHFESGMLFQASHFADVADNWGISFSVWQKGQEDRKEFNFDLVDLNDNFELGVVGNKIIYYTDKPASNWIRQKTKRLQKIDGPHLSSYVTVKSDGKDNLVENSMGYFYNKANNVYKNAQEVALLSACFSIGQGVSVVKENFREIIALFCARKSIMDNWIQHFDEYMIPNVDHPDYEQWNNDCLVYSLFNAKSNQSSLRQIDYKEKKWNIFNNFFFMSNEEMLELANDNNFDEMYQDAKQFSDNRYVYNLLQVTRLSSDAQQLLDEAGALIAKTINTRKLYHEDHPEYHLNAWDAGWAQMKPMFKEFHKEEYTEFVKKYKKFEERMREGVYKFGFLRA